LYISDSNVGHYTYLQLETFYFSRLEGSSLYDRHDDTAVLMKNSVLWDVVQCILVSRY